MRVGSRSASTRPRPAGEPAGKRSRPIVRALIAVLVIAVGAELSARWLEPGLPHAGDWPEGSIAQQVDLVTHYAKRAPIDVVFAGSSMTKKGLDPVAFSKRTGLTALNAALPASNNTLLEPWLLNVVLPKLHPRTVVIGVASRDFNDNARGPERAYHALVDSPGYRRIVPRSTIDRIERSVGRFSAVLRLRRSLRSPTNVIRAIGRPEPRVAISGCPPKSASWERYARDATVARYPHTLLRNYDAGGKQTRALIRTIGALEDRGTDVVLVKMAATMDYVRLHPHPKQNLDDFAAALDRVVEETGVPVIDGTSITDRGMFHDQIHLNCSGAARLTAILAARWPDAGGSERHNP